MPRFDGGGIGDEKKLGFDRHAKEDALAVFEREMAEKKVTDRKVRGGACRGRGASGGVLTLSLIHI